MTATIYLLVPELNDLHGKSLACHSLSLSLGFLILALSQFHEILLVEGMSERARIFNNTKIENSFNTMNLFTRLYHSILHTRLLLLVDCHVD